MNWDNYLNDSRLRDSERILEKDARNEFESDFGRVIFSPAIRRMHDKTQVFPLTTDDNIHSRLTHSMEVMSIGYSLGLTICKDQRFLDLVDKTEDDLLRQIPILLKNECLVHDIGNPPFGHFGETVIKNYFIKYFEDEEFKEKYFKDKEFKKLNLTKKQKEDFIYFDGNAQGFRVLTKLQVLGDKYGLNLTLGTLGTYLKYPNADDIDKSKLAKSKRGVFQSERDYLDKIVKGCNLDREGINVRHPLAFLMEAADSICYLVMDLEDGFNKGLYSYEDIKKKFIKVEGLEKQFVKLEERHDGLGAEVAKVVNLRIYLIKRLVDLAVENFVTKFKEICEGDYNEELIKDDPFNLTNELFEFTRKTIFPNREIQS